jgi:hypothetical protein
MRMLRLICCTLLLAVTCAGMDEPEQNPPAPGAQEPQGPVEQVAPRGEAVTEAKPVTAPQTQGTTTTATDQTLGEVRLMTRHTKLHGNTDRSFRVQGHNNLAEFNYFMDRGLMTRRIQMLSMYRGTDDRSIDPERNSLQKAYLRIYGPRDEYIFGDNLVNLSRLSFNQNIKGAQGTWALGQSWKLSSVGGVFIDRYGSLYKDLPGRPYTSMVAGTRLEYQMARDSRMGFNFSSSHDRVDSLPQALPGTAPFPADNRVLSADQRLMHKGARLDAEYGYSWTDFDKRSSAGCPTCDSRLPQPLLGFQSDYGGRVEGSWRTGPLSMRGSYVRYQPNFASINARQIADLQDVAYRLSLDVTTWMTLDGTIRRSNNNLRQQLPFKTRLWGPEAKVILRDLPFHRRATVEFGYRHRDVEATDDSVDRFVRIPFAEVNIPFGGTFFTVGYEQRRTLDYIRPALTSNANRVYVGLRGMYDAGGWMINPVLRWELERMSARPGIAQPTPDFTLLHESNRMNTAALYLQPPKWFILELAYRQSSATIFGPSGFRRPSYRAALTYKVANDENLQLIFSFERNNNFYCNALGCSGPRLGATDFDERIIGGTIVYKFGSRGR